jgi:hypothetical protein
VDDVLHEGEQVAIGDDLQEKEQPTPADKIHGREYERADDEYQQAAAAKRVDERAGEPGEEAFLRRRVLNLHLHRQAFGAAMAADLLLPVRGDTSVAEVKLAMAAEMPAGYPGVVLARPGAGGGGRGCGDGRSGNWRLVTGAEGGRRRREGDGGRGADTRDPGSACRSRRRQRRRAGGSSGHRGGWCGSRLSLRVGIEHHFQAAQMDSLPGLEHCFPHPSAVDISAIRGAQVNDDGFTLVHHDLAMGS